MPIHTCATRDSTPEGFSTRYPYQQVATSVRWDIGEGPGWRAPIPHSPPPPPPPPHPKWARILKGTVTGWHARASDPKLKKVSLIFSSWTLAFSIWRRLVDSEHGGKRSNSRRKRKYDGRGEYKKAWSKTINVFISKREFFQVCEGERFCACQAVIRKKPHFLCAPP